MGVDDACRRREPMDAPLSRFQHRLHQTRFLRPLLFAVLGGVMLGFLGGLWPRPHDTSPLSFVGICVGCSVGALSRAFGARRRASRAPAIGCAVLLVPFWFVVFGDR